MSDSEAKTFETGNYIVKIKDDEKTIQEFMITGAEIIVTPLQKGGACIPVNTK